MRIKATIVGFVFSVQCFENATIVAYAGLRINVSRWQGTMLIVHILTTKLLGSCSHVEVFWEQEGHCW